MTFSPLLLLQLSPYYTSLLKYILSFLNDGKDALVPISKQLHERRRDRPGGEEHSGALPGGKSTRGDAPPQHTTTTTAHKLPPRPTHDTDSFKLHSPSQRDSKIFDFSFPQVQVQRVRVLSGVEAAKRSLLQQAESNKWVVDKTAERSSLLPVNGKVPRSINSTHRFSILTFNDVYELAASYDGSGGLANLHSLMEQEISELEKEGIAWISSLNGDFLSASLLGPRFQGKHMIDVLNTMPLTHASLGNHEFDFKESERGSDMVLLQRISESNFKWINSNVFSRGKLFPQTLPKDVIELENESGEVVKVGIFALCTGATRVLSYPPDHVDFQNPISAARRMIAELRDEDQCDIVIALTHLTMSQDVQLATSVPGINVIIGGHDHHPLCQQQGATTIIKCGQNAKILGRIDLHIQKQVVEMKGEKITTINNLTEWSFKGNFGYPPHPKTEVVVNQYLQHLPSDWNEFLGICGSTLDSTTSLCRSTETTMCSLLADALLDHYKADATIINAGTCRGDRVYSIGTQLLKGDIYTEFPFESYPRYGCLTGAQLIGAIEDGLKNIGAGGYPHLSKGFAVTYDPSGEYGSRIVAISLNGEEIDRERHYYVVSTDWLFIGGDGYKHLMSGELIPHEEDKHYLRQHAMRWIKEQGMVQVYLEGRLAKL